MKNRDNNTLFILVSCAVAAAIAIAGLIYADKAKAGDFDSTEYKITSEFIEADRMCEDGDQAKCQRVQQFCGVMNPQRVRELHHFIRHDYPFKAKNGAMNITSRFTRALRKCSTPTQLTSAAVRG